MCCVVCAACCVLHSVCCMVCAACCVMVYAAGCVLHGVRCILYESTSPRMMHQTQRGHVCRMHVPRTIPPQHPFLAVLVCCDDKRHLRTHIAERAHLQDRHSPVPSRRSKARPSPCVRSPPACRGDSTRRAATVRVRHGIAINTMQHGIASIAHDSVRRMARRMAQRSPWRLSRAYVSGSAAAAGS